MPVFNNLFLRFGTRDDLLKGKSSFHNEVEHMKYITDNVSEQSAVFIDEFGRSTSAIEGAMLSHGILTYLERQCQYVMFATHFTLPDEERSMHSLYFNTQYKITDQKQAVNTFDIARKYGVIF